MMKSALISWLRVLLISFLSVQVRAVDVKDETQLVAGARNLGLEDYMRVTPRPTPSNNGTSPAAPTGEPLPKEPSHAPTSQPSISAPSLSPSQPPTTATPTAQITEPPTDPDTEAPTTASPTTASPTQAPSTLSPTEAPTDPPEENDVVVDTEDGATTDAPPIEEASPTTTEDNTSTEETPSEAEAPQADVTTEAVVDPAPENEAPKEVEKWNLFSETLEYQDSVGSVYVDFSLYSPNITVQEMNFMKLKMGVCTSIDGLVCEQVHPIREEGPEYCAVNDEVLLRDGTAQARLAPQQPADYEVTVMALATTNVKDDSDIVRGPIPISWTTWRLSWDVLKLGPGLREHIQESHGGDLTEAEVTEKGIEMLQKMMSVNMERTLRDGVLQKDINDFMKDIMLLTSVVGEEVETYEPIVAQPLSSAHAGQELETGEDGEGGGLMVVLFFAGLGVACFVIVGLLYFSFRSRRSRIRRKRTIVILDDTDKESSGSQQQQAAAQAAAQAASQGVTQVESQEASQDKVIVMETEDALEEDLPRAQQEQAQQQWGDASYVDGASYVGDGDAEADAESQWGRSAAQSSAYTGSISAITGVSGLEQSDTWSVGSMSIDLAEWG